MLMVVMATAVALQVAGPVTPAQIESARAALDAKLLDYPSARFRGVSGNGYAICGSVNAKNRMGAYSGWARFVTIWREGSTTLYVEEAGKEAPLVLQTFCGEGRAPVSRDLSADLTGRGS